MSHLALRGNNTGHYFGWHTACLVFVCLMLVSVMAISRASTEVNSKKVSLEFKDTDVRDVLRGLGLIAGVNIVADSTVDGKISVKFTSMELDQALDAIVSAGGYKYTCNDGVYLVSRNSFPEVTTIATDAAGRVTIRARDADLRQLLLDVSKKTAVSIVPSSNLLSTISLDLKDISSSDVVSVLAKAGNASCTLQNGVWFVEANIPKPDPAAIARSDSSSGMAGHRSGGNAVMTKSLPLNYIKASDAVDYLTKVTAQSGTGTPDTSRAGASIRSTKEENVLLVTGNEDAIARVQEDLQQIDMPAPEVMLEARLVEVYGSADKTLGLLLANGSENKTSLDLLKGQLTYASAGYTRTLNAGLQAIIDKGQGKVIASPSICTLTGHEASIDIGEVRYFKITSSDNGSSSGTSATYYPYSTIQTVSAGIVLKITPWVGASGEITASIQPEVSSVTGITSDGLPEISRRKASTTIRVKDGDTIIIGGLKQQEKTRNTTSTPILGDLPVLGALFRNTHITTRDSELMIFITPRIMRNTSEPAVEKKENDKKK